MMRKTTENSEEYHSALNKMIIKPIENSLMETNEEKDQ